MPEEQWRSVFDTIHIFRRQIRDSDGIYIRKELHAWEFVSGRGNISDQVVIKWRRCEIFKEVLSLLTNLISNEDEEAAEFISKLLRVTVNVFASDSIDIDEVANSMATIADELDADGWERIVRIREDEDHVDVYFRLSDNAEVIYGIAIMVAEPGETVLVNIVGDISVNDISALGRRFNIDELVDLDIDAN